MIVQFFARVIQMAKFPMSDVQNKVCREDCFHQMNNSLYVHIFYILNTYLPELFRLMSYGLNL